MVHNARDAGEFKKKKKKSGVKNIIWKGCWPDLPERLRANAVAVVQSYLCPKYEPQEAVKLCHRASLGCSCSPWGEPSYLGGIRGVQTLIWFWFTRMKVENSFFFPPSSIFLRGKKTYSFHFSTPSHFSFSISFLGLSAFWMLSLKGGYMNSTMQLPI